jgi:hypothetical protein
MTNAERLILRARQLLDDNTLSNNQRIQYAPALLRQLALNTPSLARRRAALNEVTDPAVQAALAAALEAIVPV